METNHIPLIMERLDKIVSKDHCNPADLWHFIQILSHFVSDRPELMNLVGIRKIPDLRTLSYRALRIDWHEINAGVPNPIRFRRHN